MPKPQSTPKPKTFRRQDQELLKRPKGMPRKIFTDIAWLLALELKAKEYKRQEEKIEYRPRRK